jgi:hypothetical protein
MEVKRKSGGYVQKIITMRQPLIVEQVGRLDVLIVQEGRL